MSRSLQFPFRIGDVGVPRTSGRDSPIREQLEQLRALSLGMTIRVAVPDARPGAGVDTEEDLIVAAAELAK